MIPILIHYSTYNTTNKSLRIPILIHYSTYNTTNKSLRIPILIHNTTNTVLITQQINR